MRSLLLVLSLILCWSATVIGEESTWIPGGESARESVDARRGNTALSKLAATRENN